MLEQALELEPGERDAFLDHACAQDEALRAAVVKLLSTEQAGASLLEHGGPAAATALAEQHREALEPGQHLGAYRIERSLGAGGMGEVFLATDSRLGREVAIKVLPHHLKDNQQLRSRFEREARAISNLSHPHICVLHDIGSEDGIDFLVMERLEGETLRSKLEAGSLEQPLALTLATQIARALDAAHRRGIVHRDLKPENIFLTRSGAKLLDFGLAKFEGVSIGPVGSQLPTQKATLTAEGSILGTLHYMAPEQLEGKDADSRTDVFAFGSVLYEMLTGQRAFKGESQASVISAILSQRPPSIQELQHTSPEALDRLVRTCMEKDPEDRWQSMGDVGRQLAWIAEAGPEARTPQLALDQPEARPSARSRWTPLLGAILGGAGTLLLVWGASRFLGPGLPEQPRTNASALTPHRASQQTQTLSVEGSATISPDGEFFAFSVDRDRSDSLGADIYLQRTSGERPIQITQHPADDWAPAFSPDGSTLAFCSERDGVRAVFLVGATGEAERKILDNACWPAWSPDGRRLATVDTMFHSAHAGVGPPVESFQILALDSGTTTSLDAAPLDTLHQPSWSPDGQRLVFWGMAQNESTRDLWIFNLATEQFTRLTDDPAVDWSPWWSADGTIYFVSDRGGTNNLWRINPELAAPIPEAVTVPAKDIGFPTVSRTGERALYLAQSTRDLIVKVPLLLRDQSVGPEEILAAGDGFMLPRVSPDGEQVVFLSLGATPDLFLMGIDGTDLRRVTHDEFSDRWPRFTPDGAWISFFSNRGGEYELWTIRPDGSALEKLGARLQPLVGSQRRVARRGPGFWRFAALSCAGVEHRACAAAPG